MRIAITGHRPNRFGNDYDLKSPLIQSIKIELQKIVEKHKPTEMISGMALGIDTLWALLAIENYMRSEQWIQLIAAIPFRGQESMWPQKSKNTYQFILDHPMTQVKEICQPGYASWKMQKRNEWMVDNCDLLIAVWDGTSGGTGNCVKYADGRKEIIRINPLEMK